MPAKAQNGDAKSPGGKKTATTKTAKKTSAVSSTKSLVLKANPVNVKHMKATSAAKKAAIKATPFTGQVRKVSVAPGQTKPSAGVVFAPLQLKQAVQQLRRGAGWFAPAFGSVQRSTTADLLGIASPPKVGALRTAARRAAAPSAKRAQPAVHAPQKAAVKRAAAKAAETMPVPLLAPEAATPDLAPTVEALEVARGLLQLQARVKMEQLRKESEPPQDLLILRPAANSVPDSSDVQILNSLNAGNLARLAKGRAASKQRKNGKLDVVRSIHDGLVVRAGAETVRALKRQSPGLRMMPATYAYIQSLMPLGEALREAEIQVASGVPVTAFTVLVRGSDEKPVAGARVMAFTDWDGAHVASVSDSKGKAQFRLPRVYPEVTFIQVEPAHTYWPLSMQGFDRANAPKTTVARLKALEPDAYKVFSHYAPYKSDAGKGVKVAVIDSGVGPHVDVSVAGGACLVTGEDPEDHEDNGSGHGTHVAGIIGAKLSAGGTYGLAPAAELFSYRVCPRKGNLGRGSSVDIAAAIEQAIAAGCDLINISMGSVQAMPEVPEMLEKARMAGAVVIAATGNDGQELLRYPARYSHAVAVGALGRDDTFPDDSPASLHESEIREAAEWVAVFSNYGMGAHFTAPGVAVISTYPGDRLQVMSGTSMSTPFTTGMAARLLSDAPAVLNMPRGPERADAIVRLMMDNTREIGWNAQYGAGVLR